MHSVPACLIDRGAARINYYSALSRLAAQRADAVFAEVSPWNEVEHLIIYNTHDQDEQQIETMMTEGRRVLAAIPGVRRVFTGRAYKDEAKYRYCWLVRFAHPKVVESYREHPDHVAFADMQFRPLSAGRISIDYYAVESASEESLAKGS